MQSEAVQVSVLASSAICPHRAFMAGWLDWSKQGTETHTHFLFSNHPTPWFGSFPLVTPWNLWGFQAPLQASSDLPVVPKEAV